MASGVFVSLVSHAQVSGVEPVAHTQCSVFATSSGCWLPYEVDRRPFPVAASASVHVEALASVVDFHSSSYPVWVVDTLIKLM